MKCWISLIMILLIACKNKECEGFTTAEDLDKTDMAKCKLDSMYVYMKQFSLAWNNERKRLGLPLLPKHFTGLVYTVNNQVRWQDMEKIEDRNYTQPFLHHKDIEWNGGQLRYDRTFFSANDSLKQLAGVVYSIDTTNLAEPVYKTTYYYLNRHYPVDSSSTISKNQMDSILQKWKIPYYSGS